VLLHDLDIFVFSPVLDTADSLCSHSAGWYYSSERPELKANRPTPSNLDPSSNPVLPNSYPELGKLSPSRKG
jgi:hypothetical protein